MATDLEMSKNKKSKHKVSTHTKGSDAMQKWQANLRKDPVKYNDWVKKRTGKTKGKTFEDIYGDRADKEREKISLGVKKLWGDPNSVYHSESRMLKIIKSLSGKHTPNPNDFQKGELSPKKGKTFVQLYGEERAKELIYQNSITHMGESNHFWRGGISKLPYSFEFDNNLKEKIRKRDDYTCQLCGTMKNVYYETLGVHHIDYNKKNFSDDNLITLCNLCNSKVNANRDFWEYFFKEQLNAQ